MILNGSDIVSDHPEETPRRDTDAVCNAMAGSVVLQECVKLYASQALRTARGRGDEVRQVVALLRMFAFLDVGRGEAF